jgi:hypothetical protein
MYPAPQACKCAALPSMKILFPLLLIVLARPAEAQKTLPELRDGTVVNERASYRHDGPLRVEGRVKLKGLSLDLRGPITIASGATFELEDVHIQVSDPVGSPNGTSGLRCEGPANIIIRRSTMAPKGSAHPMWGLKGELTVDNFQTENSEFHLDHVRATLENLKIFELEISHASEVGARHLRLVFLSTHTGEDDRIAFSDIPSDQAFSQKLLLGSTATADLADTVAKFFLLYVHGKSDVSLKHIGRAQLAIAPDCQGKLRLPHGLVGSESAPAAIPEPGASNCPFRFRLVDVNADTWDVYAGDKADLTFTGSVIDELTANGNAKISVQNSDIYADWLSLGGNSELQVRRSTVGALRLTSERPDLATSQVRLRDKSRATFDNVIFDCGIVVNDDATLAILHPVTSPRYIRRSDRAVVRMDPAAPSQDKRKR